MQIADLGPLGTVVTRTKTVAAQPAGFEPAPMPDPDVDAPISATRPRANVSPRLFSAKNEFQGDGYSFGSSQQTSLEQLKKPAAGLGISVPVKYGPSD